MKNHKDFWFNWFVYLGLLIVLILVLNTASYFLCDSPNCNHRFLVFKIASQIFILATAIVWIIFHFIDYVTMNKKNDNSVKMKFNHFKDVYYVNPDRWCIDNGRLLYEYIERYRYDDHYYVTFSYFDWLKFLLWKTVDDYYERIKRKRRKEDEANKRMAEMLKYVQKDINEAYEKMKEKE